MSQQSHFDRCMLSQDGRLVLSGRIVIQLTENLINISDIGVIVFEKNFSGIKYHFISLLCHADRDEIEKLINKPMTLKSIVKFDYDN